MESIERCRQDLVPRRNTALGNAEGSGSDSLSRHIYLDAGASVSDAWVGTHADACNLIHIRWLNDGERERPSLYIYRKKRKGEREREVGGRGSKSRQREVTSMPIRAIHISWNTTLLRGPFHLTRYVISFLLSSSSSSSTKFIISPLRIFRVNRAIEIPRFEKVSLV